MDVRLFQLCRRHCWIRLKNIVCDNVSFSVDAVYTILSYHTFILYQINIITIFKDLSYLFAYFISNINVHIHFKSGKIKI